jgi:hypothetical protein
VQDGSIFVERVNGPFLAASGSVAVQCHYDEAGMML